MQPSPITEPSTASSTTSREAHEQNERASTYLSAGAWDARQLWSAWEGREVEGRLAGVHTLFLAEFDTKAHWRVAGMVREYPHVLFGWSYLAAHGWTVPMECALRGQLFTVEVNAQQLVDMPILVREVAHIILRIPAPQFPIDFLKPTDTLRIDRDYLDVATVTYHSMRRYYPSLYSHDYPLVTRERT